MKAGDITTFSSTLNCTRHNLYSSIASHTNITHAAFSDKLYLNLSHVHTSDQIGHAVLSSISCRLFSSLARSISWPPNFSCVPQSVFCDVGQFSFDDLALQLLKSGKPPHPGPSQQVIRIMSWNINSLSKYMASVVSRPFDICFVQEVSAPWHMMRALFQRLKDAKCKALLTGTDLELVKTGGVGTITRNKISTMKLKPSTPTL